MTLGSSNPNIKRIRKLAQKASFRRDEGAFLVEGPRAVEAALRSGTELEGLYFSSDLPGEWRHLLDAAAETHVSIHEADAHALQSALDAETPQGVAVIARMASEDSLPPLTAGPMVVLDEVRDPGNSGTILRSAHAAGVATVVFLPGSVDPFNPKTVRSSAGYICFVRCRRPASKSDFLSEALDAGCRLLGTSGERGSSCFESDLTGAVALVVGNEGSGITPEVASRISEWVRIPTATSLESLNVAIAASVLLFEALRQRGGSL